MIVATPDVFHVCARSNDGVVSVPVFDDARDPVVWKIRVFARKLVPDTKVPEPPVETFPPPFHAPFDVVLPLRSIENIAVVPAAPPRKLTKLNSPAVRVTTIFR